MSKGDRFCNSCFAQRENNASRTYHEHYDLAYWGFYTIPILGPFIALGKYIKYPGGIRYHVYINRRHERWSRHTTDEVNLQKCDNCHGWDDVYYELESYE